LSHFFDSDTSNRPVSPNFQAPQLTPSVSPVEQIPWLDLLRALLFWGVFLAVLVFGIDEFLRQHNETWQKFRSLPFLAWLSRGWRWLWDTINAYKDRIKGSFKAGLQRVSSITFRPKVEVPWKFVSLRRLSPRERIVFFYLALLRRGQESGLARKPSQTPYTYAERLRLELPGVEEELNNLTAEFVEARYSRHEVSSEQVSLVRRAWARIRRVLKNIRK
jgi:hypothetical protein